jgi:hypothetical protein
VVAWPELDEELTEPDDDCSPEPLDEVLDELFDEVLDDELDEVLVEAELVVAVDPLELELPGMVAAAV